MVKVRFEERPAGSATMSPAMPTAVNYYRWIVAKLLPHAGDCILDIGGGYGAHLEYVLPKGCPVVSIDLSESSVEFMRERFRQYPHFEAARLDFGQHESQAELIRRGFDTIFCLNVLEHIEDDLAALKDMHAILAPRRGKLLLQVPAHEWLYGSLDAQAGHYRRYSAAYLRQVLEGAGFTVQALYHFNSIGVLPWFVNARVLKKSLEADSVNTQITVFDRYIVPVMSRVEAVVRLPFGQSLMAVAQAGLC